MVLQLCGATPALAQQSPGGADPAHYAPTMLILDASGSMLVADAGGGSKMDAAKRAVHTFVDTAPEESMVGLIAYGTGTGSSDAEKATGCADVTPLRGPQTLDRTALNAAVDTIVPRGYTPIGASLRKAAELLPSQEPGSIVLVSDGLDTCSPPDPCAIAKELRAQGHQIIMHAIGFGVDNTSRAQLTCIAQTTGGTYSDAIDGPTLAQVLPRVTATALRDYVPAGTPVTGTPDYHDAPLVVPGQYLDVLSRKTHRHYALDIPDGSTAYFSATVSFPRGGGSALYANNRLDLRVADAQGRDCDIDERALASRSTDGVALTVGTIFTEAAERTGTGSCRVAGRYYFDLEWAMVADSAPEQLTLEMNVGLESGVSDPGPPPMPNKAVDFAAPSGSVRPVVGGGSFNVAATLAGSGSYSDTLQRGEFVFYRVRLEWGQVLAFRIRYAATPQRGPAYYSNISTTLYGPNRTELASGTTAYAGFDEVLPGATSALATMPIRYRNRETNGSDSRGQSLAGWYYIAAKLGPGNDPAQARNAPVPITVEAAVVGSAEQGPTYRTVAVAGTFGEDAQSGGAVPDRSAAGGSASPALPPLLLVSGAAIVIVLTGAVAAMLILRRRSRRMGHRG